VTGAKSGATIVESLELAPPGYRMTAERSPSVIVKNVKWLDSTTEKRACIL
jgi:hypothetical protein